MLQNLLGRLKNICIKTIDTERIVLRDEQKYLEFWIKLYIYIYILHRMEVVGRRGEPLKKQNLRPTVEHRGFSVMV